MPKKFGTNTKAAEARERKEAAKIAERVKKEKAAEDALWKDDDKHVVRKQQRKVFNLLLTTTVVFKVLINLK